MYRSSFGPRAYHPPPPHNRPPSLPPIFHFVWLGKEASPPTDMSASWAHYHPRHKIIHWRGDRVKALIHRQFPQLLPIFNGTSSCPWLQSIVARVAILAAIGGVYLDYDLEACGSLERFAYPSASCILVANAKPLWGESKIKRGIMASRPAHPFLLAAIDAMTTFKKRITSYTSKDAQKLREVLKKVLANHRSSVTVVSDAVLVDFGSFMPMHKMAIGVFRSPPSHHWEKWYHKLYRKYHVFCKENPAAGRMLTYFFMGMVTGIVMNLIVILVLNAVNNKRRSKGKHPI